MTTGQPPDDGPPAPVPVPPAPAWSPPAHWAPPQPLPQPPPYGAYAPVHAPQRRPRPRLLPLEGRRPPLWVPLLLVATMVGLAVRTWLKGGDDSDLTVWLPRELFVTELIGVAIVLGVVLVGRWWRSVGLVPRRGSGVVVRAIAAAQALVCLALVAVAGAQDGAGPRWYVVLGLNCLAIGVLEETLFRGLLWASLPARWPESRVLLVTAVSFGALHLSNGLVTGRWGTAALQALLASFMGLWLGSLRLRTGWLGASIGLHAVHDAAAAGLATLVASGVLRQTSTTHLDIPAGVLLAVLAFEVAYLTVVVSGVVVWVRLVVDGRREKRAAAPPAGPAPTLVG